MVSHRFEFAFAPLYRPVAAVFGIRPATAFVTVDETVLVARFGPWLLRTPIGNIVDTQSVGGFGLLRTLGPARWSLADGGLTMATNRELGVCLRFVQPVPGLAPTGRLRHPGLTVTVADCPGLIAAVRAGMG